MMHWVQCGKQRSLTLLWDITGTFNQLPVSVVAEVFKPLQDLRPVTVN